MHTPEVSTSHTIVFAGDSHASRIAEAARSAYPEVVDLSIGGWRLSKDSAAELAHDLNGVLDDADEGSHTVVLHLFDNAIFKGEVNGKLADPIKSTEHTISKVNCDWLTQRLSNFCLNLHSPSCGPVAPPTSYC